MVTLDPTTGNTVHMQEHKMLVTWLDDSAYLGLMVYLYNMTGVSRMFIPLAETFFDNPAYIQALRYGMMFGSMLELRRFLEMAGLKTDIISYWMNMIFHRLM